jgi:putative hydrolase of the HAD superfamily
MIYRHYSFDLWLTLIRSHPEYKPERARWFHERYNEMGRSLAEVSGIFTNMDRLANLIDERTGGQITAEEVYLWVIGRINEGNPRLEALIRGIDTGRLYEEMEQLFLAYPPGIYDEKTLPVLERLRAYAPGSTFGLLSNTVFIKGRTLRRVLPGIGLCFDIQLFSDEEGVSKPNPTFFQKMITEVERRQGRVDPKDIIHVGDNPVADISGARAAGLASLLVNSNQQSIANLLTT